MNNEWSKLIQVILFLNKQDLADKIKNGYRFENYFPDLTRAKYFIYVINF